MAECKEEASVFPYWKYPQFSLCCVNEDHCLTEFRFEKNDLPRLVNALRIPDKIVCPNGTTGNSIEGLCILVRRFAYQCPFSDMIPRFGRSKPKLCLIQQQVMRHVSSTFGHLLTTFDQDWLQRDTLESYQGLFLVKAKHWNTFGAL